MPDKAVPVKTPNADREANSRIEAASRNSTDLLDLHRSGLKRLRESVGELRRLRAPRDIHLATHNASADDWPCEANPRPPRTESIQEHLILLLATIAGKSGWSL